MFLSRSGPTSGLEEFQSVLPGNKPLRKLLSDLKYVRDCHELVSSLARPEDPWQQQKHHQPS